MAQGFALPPAAVNAGIGAIDIGGSTEWSSGTVQFAAGANITLSTAGQTVTIIGAAGGGGAGSITLGMSNLGNTSGTTGVVSGSAVRLLLAGGNNITLSQSLDGVSGTITISAPNQSNQTIGVYGSSQTTYTSSGTIDARSMTIVGQGGISVGVSNGSIVLSGATGGGGGAAATIEYFDNVGNASGTAALFNNLGYSFNELRLQPLDAGFRNFPGRMTVSSLMLDVSANFNATSQNNFTYTTHVGIYSVSNSTQIGLLYQADFTLGTNATAPSVSSLVNGARFLVIESSQWSNATGGAATPSLTEGLYFVGILPRSSSSAPIAFNAIGVHLGLTQQRSGEVGASRATGNTMGFFPFLGILGTTTSALPATIGITDVSHPVNPNRVQRIVLNNKFGQF